ncbi:MAG TPA: glycosyltransferase family 25 protein [Stellaceae bacterium]
MSYTGFYINLDRSRERRAEIEAQLAQHKLEHVYARFKAADGNALDLPNPHLKSGEMGCFTSHYLLLKKNLDAPKHLHVIEDDVVFSSHVEKVIRATIDNGGINSYDIIFTDTYIPINVDAFRMYKELYDRSVVRDGSGAIVNAAFNVIDLAGLLFATTSSYLVNAKSIRKLYNIYTKEITNSPRVPIDLLIRAKAAQGVIKVGCIFPFITSIRLDGGLDTTIADRAEIGRHDKLTVLAGDIARQSFFVEASLSKCRDFADKFLAPPPGDTHHALLTSILGFAIGSGYRAI